MNFIARFFKNWRRKKKLSTSSSPARPIDDAFRDYIRNEIPPRLVDTSTLRFVSRNDVFNIFKDQIACVTEDWIQERIRNLQEDPRGINNSGRDAILGQIIQETIRYTVISYSWDQLAGVPTYTDMVKRKWHVSKPTNLVKFCKTSRRMGFRLAWVDTCCVDNTNPTELDEVTHAKYRWYANSHVCIVYLAEATSCEEWSSDPWFTRCWTLQELLAPKRLKFYGRNWQPLTPPEVDDDRKYDKILPYLMDATNISRRVLAADNSQGVKGCSFWEIMSWLMKREEVHIEDRAYCLFGLFGISLAVTEGQCERAFSRFMKTVVENNPSWDILVWFGQPCTSHFALPPSPASYPTFDADVVVSRSGIQELSIMPHQVSFSSLPPIPIEFGASEPSTEPGNRYYRVYLKQKQDESPLVRFTDLLVECGSGRLEIIKGAGQLSACILNHHSTRHREDGRLVAGQEYICWLLYRCKNEDGGKWIKLVTDNLLHVTCLGISQSVIGDAVTQGSTHVTNGKGDIAGPDELILPMVKITVQSPMSPS